MLPYLRSCIAVLVCAYCIISASLGERVSASECPDFNNFDVCKASEVDRLQVSFGEECNVIIAPQNAGHEPVVKYNDADEVCSSILWQYSRVRVSVSNSSSVPC